MEKWIKADAVNKALDRIREEVWLHDIPSPTVPEYIEHHDAIQQIMLVIDKERKLLNDAAADVAPVRHGQWEQDEIAHGLNVWLCSACGQPTQLLDGDVSAKTPYCPNCGARMDGGDGE